MSHNFTSGFSVREVPWHGLGNVLDDYPGSWAEARTLAGLDWEPEEVPCYEVDEVYADGRCTVKLIEDFKQIKRSDTGARLDIAGEGYHIISHQVMGDIYEAIQDASKATATPIRYETAGALEGGKRVWALARLGDVLELPGDPSGSQPYLALLNSHDGSAALKVVATVVRIVCANTWHMADVDASARGSAYSFKHTKNWKLRVEDAVAALTNSTAEINHYVAEARAMLEVKVNALQTKTFIEQFAINRVIANTVGKQPRSKRELAARMDQPRVQAALTATIADLTGIIESRTCDGIRGTMYGLVQAGGEFADHFRESKNPGSYFSRTVLADKEPLKQMAVRVAGELVNA